MLLKGFLLNFNFTAPVHLSGEGIYQLSSVKKIEVSDAFLGFNFETRKCQNQKPLKIVKQIYS